MQNLAFKTYLIGQCSKLAQIGELNAYCQGTDGREPLADEFWQVLKIAPTMRDTALFAESEKAAHFFEQLPSESLARLTEILSLHHNNGVFNKIKREATWEKRTFTLEKVEVGYTEQELKPSIRSHSHDLRLVAADLAVISHPHYRDRDLLNAVPYDVFLAVWKSDRVRLFDGNHRAIHLARQIAGGHIKTTSLEVMVPRR